MDATSRYRAGPDTPHDRFLDQFEWDGSDWLYRYRETGAAYRVTDAEKDAFVAAFDRWGKWSGWTAAAVFFGLFFVLWKAEALPSLPPGSGLLGVFIGTGGRHVLDLIGFRAPPRALEHRASAAPALSKTARAQLALDRISPSELIGTSFAAAGFLFLLGVVGWPFDGFGLFLIACCGWMAARAIMQLIRTRQVAGRTEPITSPAT